MSQTELLNGFDFCDYPIVLALGARGGGRRLLRRCV